MITYKASLFAYEDATLAIERTFHGPGNEQALDPLDLRLHLRHAGETLFDSQPARVLEEAEGRGVHQVGEDRRPIVLCLKLHSKPRRDADTTLRVHDMLESASCHRMGRRLPAWEILG